MLLVEGRDHDLFASTESHDLLRAQLNPPLRHRGTVPRQGTADLLAMRRYSLPMSIRVQDISEQLTWHWDAQLRPRLAGITDDEFFWEPTPGAWSVRRTESGEFAPDWLWPAPEPAPVTTIGWRLCHIWMLFAQRADFHFGERALTVDRLHWPGTAEATLAAIDEASTAWRAGVEGLSDADADRRSEGPPGTADGRFPLWAVVLHVNREVIHHGAEVALLRDLYQARSNVMTV